MNKVKSLLIILLSCLVLLFIPGNMAAPKIEDKASTITFEKNDSIGVTKEVLDIRINKDKANIKAMYYMKNNTSSDINTKSMFISPNIENESVTVKQDDLDIPFVRKTYALDYDSKIEKDEWKFVVIDPAIENDNNELVDTINFELNFVPNKEYVVTVSYNYSLGGRPERKDNYKYGELRYYLSPASMWSDFNDLTINLYLDEDMPVLSKSSLDFKKMDNNYYKYQSNVLPKDDLYLMIEPTGFQNFIGFFKNPYFYSNLMLYLPFIIGGIVIVILITIGIVKITKHYKKK